MSKQVFYLANPINRANCVQAVRTAPDGFKVTIAEPSRTLDQNSAQWPILEAFSKQLEWPVNGQFVKLSADDWKTLLTAAFRQEGQQMALGLNGGVVFLGMRTSKMLKKEFSEYLEFLHATAALRGVVL